MRDFGLHREGGLPQGPGWISKGSDMAAGGKKPAWVVEKERGQKAEARLTALVTAFCASAAVS